MTRIDLFVLDIEGTELDVLKTLPFEKVDVAIFMIEMYGKSEEEIRTIHKFLQSKGYTFYDSLHGGMHPGDDIFIKSEIGVTMI
jgi:esterase/lipase